MTKKKSHLPFDGNLYSRIDGYKLPELLAEFRVTQSHLFHNVRGLDLTIAKTKIYESIDDYHLAIHPIFWDWLKKKVGIRAGLVIAHWLIDTRNYRNSQDFIDWSVNEPSFSRKLGALQVNQWLKGEQIRSNKNRQTHIRELPTPKYDEISEALWRKAVYMCPEWASGDQKRLPFGLAKELSRSMISSKSISSDSVRKRLDRMRKLNLK